jgi:hypothetical protein
MDMAKAHCPNCDQSMTISRLICSDCSLVLEGSFEVSPLARLSTEDQVFVTAFIRYHGSIKKMEELFDISYPTVKNRLNAIGAALDKGYQAPSANAIILEQISRGEITVSEALERMK